MSKSNDIEKDSEKLNKYVVISTSQDKNSDTSLDDFTLRLIEESLEIVNLPNEEALERTDAESHVTTVGQKSELGEEAVCDDVEINGDHND